MTTGCATSRQHSCTFQNSSKAKLKGVLEKPITCAQALPRFSMRAGKHTLILNYPANIVRPSPHPSLLSFVFQQGKASLWPSPSSQTHRKSPPTTEPAKSQWMDPENLEVSGPPLGLAPLCPRPSWYTQAPGTMSSKPCYQSASPRCGWNLSQREMSGPCREGEFYFWRSHLSKAVSGFQALFSKHLFRGQKEIRVTQVHVRIIWGQHGPKDQIRGKVPWKTGQAQRWPKKGQRVRVDHKGLITIHAGLLFIWRLEMKSTQMTLFFLCHRSKSYDRIV